MNQRFSRRQTTNTTLTRHAAPSILPALRRAALTSLHPRQHAFKVPFVCGCRDLGEALRRISEGAAFIRTKGEAGTGNVVEAVRHQRATQAQIRRAASMTDEELYAFAKDLGAPFHLLKECARLKRLPVVNFAAGGIATPGACFSAVWRQGYRGT